MRRRAVLLALVALLAAGCEPDATEPGDADGTSVTAEPSLVPPRETVEDAPGPGIPKPGPQRLVSGEAARVMEELCVAPDLDPDADRPGAAPTDARIAAVEDQVAELRGLRWLRPVVAEPIDDAEMDRRIERAFEVQFPEDLYDRRTLAWRAIGAIGTDDDLHEAMLAFGRGQVVGFYDPQSGELVYLADDDGGDLGLSEKAVLAHELVHALDDQHFDLRRLDALAAGCRDEELAAALGVVEGSAQHFSMEVLLRYPAPLDVGVLAGLAAGVPDEVPPFVAQLQLLSYTEGQAFVGAIADERGSEAVDGALERLPTTTEHLLHPERWPGDVATPVEPIDLADGSSLPSEWRDLDVMQVGEMWLRELLRLRIEDELAEDAAAGWDGGAYRAWDRPGDDGVVVTMRTAWDSREDAEAFAEALQEWIDAGTGTARVLRPTRATVDAVFVLGDVSLAAVTEGA